MIHIDTVTRLEIIDYTLPPDEIGVVYSNRGEDIKVELSLQDDERTLKVFITKRE